MAAYGSLTIKVIADTKQMASDIKSGATQAGTEAAGGISKSFSSGLAAFGGLAKATGAAVATGMTLAAGAAVTFGVASFKTAARVGEMDASLKALAAANNVSYESMQNAVTAIRKQGIEAGVAQTTVAQFTRANIDLAQGVKLAAVAQDAAVIAGRNSTEVLDDLIHGITTQNTQVLRNAGITVNATKAQDEYAKSIGKSRSELTEAEKSQAVLNAVLTEGKKVWGAYDAAMKEPGKVLRSFPRLFDDIKLSVGQGLVKAFAPLILQTYALAKGFSEAIAPGGKLAPVVEAIGEAMVKVIAPLTAMVGRWAEWITNLKPEQVEKIVSAISRLGPAAIAAAGAMAAMVAPSILKEVPVLGGIFLNLEKPLQMLVSPVKMLGGHFGTLGKSAMGAVPGLSKMGGASAALPAFMNPVGLVILAVVAAIGAMLAASSSFREGVISMGKALYTGLQPGLTAVWGMLKTFGLGLWEIVRAVGDALGPALKNLAPLLTSIGKLFGTNLAGGAEGAGSAMSGIIPVIVQVIGVIGTVLDITTRVLVPILQFGIGLLTAASAAVQVVNPIRILGTVLNALVTAISAVVRWIFGGSPGLIPAFVAAAAAAAPFSAAMSAVMGVLRALAGVISAVVSAMVGVFSAGWQSMISAASGGVNAVRSAVSAGFNAVRSAVTSAMSAVSSAVGSGMSAARSAAASGSNAVRSAVSSAFGALPGVVRSAMSQVAGAVSSGLSSAVGAARAGGAAIMSGLQGGIQSAAGAVMSTISSVASKISGALSSALKIGSPSRLTIPMGRFLAQGLGVGWDREIDSVIADMAAELHAPQVAGAGLGGFGDLGGLGGSAAGPGTTINVYPQAGADEREIAVMVSRELAWANAGGMT